MIPFLKLTPGSAKKMWGVTPALWDWQIFPWPYMFTRKSAVMRAVQLLGKLPPQFSEQRYPKIRTTPDRQDGTLVL